MGTADGIGPVQYLVVAFPGSRFEGRIVPAIAELVDSGVIRIIDLLFVIRGSDGSVDAYELAELRPEEAEAFRTLEPADELLLNDEDVELIAQMLEPGDSAAVLVWEDVWATRLADALRDAGAVTIALDRVPREAVEAAIAAGTGV